MEHDGLGCGAWRRIAAGDTLGTMDTHTTAPAGITLAGAVFIHCLGTLALVFPLFRYASKSAMS
jgi:hypothetical protein